MLKIYVRHGMVVEKIHAIISFKQSKWLEKHTDYNTQKRNLSKISFEKDFYKILINSFYGKTKEIVRERIGIEIFKKDDFKNVIRQQSELMFSGIHKSYEKCDSYTFKQNAIPIYKQIISLLVY